MGLARAPVDGTDAEWDSWANAMAERFLAGLGWLGGRPVGAEGRRTGMGIDQVQPTCTNVAFREYPGPIV